MIELKIFRAYSSLKPHILFYSNCLAICHDFPDITHNNVNTCNGCKSEFDQFEKNQGIFDLARFPDISNTKGKGL